MSALEDFTSAIGSTDVMRQIRTRLEREPVRILGRIWKSYRETNQPVPDYHLELVGYISESALEALIAAGYVKRNPGGNTCIYSYEPTEKGLKLCRQLEKGKRTETG